jgi:hypothetical protein
MYPFQYNYFGLQKQVNTTFIRNNQYMPSQVGIWIHSNWQKKHKLTKVKMDRPTTKTTEEIWNGFYLVAAVADYDNMVWCCDSCVSGHPRVQALYNFMVFINTWGVIHAVRPAGLSLCMLWKNTEQWR